MIPTKTNNSSKLKVSILSYNIGPYGGIEKMILQVGQALQAAGCEVEGISVSSSNDNCIINNMQLINIQPRNIWMKRIYSRIQMYWIPIVLKKKIVSSDIILVAHFHLLEYAISVSMQKNMKVWLIAHGIEIWRDWTPKEKELIKKCERIVAVSKFTANSILDRLPENSERIVVIPNMIDKEQFKPSSIPINDTPRVILTVGRLNSTEAYKGHDLIIRSLLSLEKRLNAPVEYHIVGEGDDKARLLKIAQNCKVSEKVHFLGHLDGTNFLNEFHKCHVFAMPSFVSKRTDGSWTGEGFGIAYIEAAACSKPILACDNGGQVDCIIDKETGILVKPTIDSVVNGLVEILMDLKKAQKMGKCGRNFILDNFTEEIVYPQWENLITNKIIQKKCAG